MECRKCYQFLDIEQWQCVATNGQPAEVSEMANETPGYLTEDKVQNAVSTKGADWDAEKSQHHRKPRNPPRHKVSILYTAKLVYW